MDEISDIIIESHNLHKPTKTIHKPKKLLNFVIEGEDEDTKIEDNTFLHISKTEYNSSKNSLTAKSGFKAEEIFRNDVIIKKALENYFNLNIIHMEKIQGKKYDTKIMFNNNTTINIQNKKIESLGGRGDSFDRRHIKNTFETQFIRKYLTHLSLIRKSKTETFMTEEQLMNNRSFIFHIYLSVFNNKIYVLFKWYSLGFIDNFFIYIATNKFILINYDIFINYLKFN